MILPSILKIYIKNENAKAFRLWIPLFLLWPFALALFILLFPLVVLAALFRLAWTGHYFPVGRFTLHLYQLFSAMLGTKVQIHTPSSHY